MKQNSAILHVQLIGRGEHATRMEKRVHCAAKAIGVSVQLEREAGEISECKLMFDGEVILDHLVSTIELEKLFSHHLKP